MPFDPVALSKVTTLVTHAHCSDGLVSAMVVKDALPTVEILFCGYNTPEHEDLPARPGLLFCDFIPPLRRIDEFVGAGALVLDHHKTAEAYVQRFGEGGIYADAERDPGVSGAVLAYQHVWRPLHPQVRRKDIEDFVRLVGVRDTWQKNDPAWEDALRVHEALNFYSSEEWLGPKGVKVFVPGWDGRLTVGDALVRKNQLRVKEASASTFRSITKKGTRVAVVQGVHVTSDLAEFLRSEIDLLVGFRYYVDSDGKTRLQLSFRTGSTGYDVGKLAVFAGGGGHKAAAGVVQILSREDPNPYEAIRGLLEAYEG